MGREACRQLIFLYYWLHTHNGNDLEPIGQRGMLVMLSYLCVLIVIWSNILCHSAARLPAWIINHSGRLVVSWWLLRERGVGWSTGPHPIQSQSGHGLDRGRMLRWSLLLGISLRGRCPVATSWVYWAQADDRGTTTVRTRERHSPK